MEPLPFPVFILLGDLLEDSYAFYASVDFKLFPVVALEDVLCCPPW